jgi:hypothetical protein
MSGDASISVVGELTIAPTYGELSVVGSGVSLSAGPLSWQGRVSIALDETGISPIDVSGSSFASGQLATDASACDGGEGSIDLIKCSSVCTSSFGPANIVLSGLAGELMAELVVLPKPACRLWFSRESNPMHWTGQLPLSLAVVVWRQSLS